TLPSRNSLVRREADVYSMVSPSCRARGCRSARSSPERTVALKRPRSRPTLLILDDFAIRDFTLSQADDLYELVTERGPRPAIFTANRQASDWYSLFPNPVVAESILDRIVNSAHHVHMDGRSYRPNRRPGAKAAKP
ncbi:MAG TPA: ATP-binding protein, partial [Actinomycetota bacterium]|nr:ATP-binding protein [Actinomycetota bacterium]